MTELTKKQKRDRKARLARLYRESLMQLRRGEL